MKKSFSFFIVFLFVQLNIFAEKTISIPKINLGINGSDKPEDLVTSLQILLILTVLSLAPSIIIMTTSFIRIIIVLHFVRQALGLQQMPPNQVLVGLSLFLTFFIMQPTIDNVFNNGINPYLDRKISQEVMIKNIEVPMKDFMLRQTRVKDLELFLKISKTKPPAARKDIPIWIVIPSYIVSEITRGFEIGILLFIPFIVIDMVVSTVLMSLGMMMLPPVMISLPFKLLVFVMVDGWSLIIEALVKSFK